jgi:hypothetical protein
LPITPDIADKVFAPLLQGFHRRDDLEPTQVRAAAHHEHPLGIHAAALDGDAPVRFVGGNRDIGRLECPALEPAQEPVEEIPAAEFRLVELGVDVVVIENELLAEQLEEPTDQKNRIRGIAGVDDVESACQQHSPGQHELPEQRHGVLQRVAQRTLSLRGQRVAVNMKILRVSECSLLKMSGLH